MDPVHQRLARIALATAGDFGFCLAGGYAVQAHGFLDRPSEDVDLFTARYQQQEVTVKHDFSDVAPTDIHSQLASNTFTGSS